MRIKEKIIEKRNVIIFLLIILLLSVDLLLYTKLIFFLLFPYILILLFIVIEIILFNKRLTKLDIIKYFYFGSIIFISQTFLLHYYWNALNNEILSILNMKQNMQSVEAFKKLAYSMDEIYTHKLMLLSISISVLILSVFIYFNRGNISNKKILAKIMESQVVKFFASLFGIIFFFLSIEGNTFYETFILLFIIYLFLQIKSIKTRREDSLLVIFFEEVYLVFYYSFLSLSILKILFFNF